MSGRRWRCLRKRRDLCERLGPSVEQAKTAMGTERIAVAPAEPIRCWLEGWAAATGDPFDVIALGFGLDQDLVRYLLHEELHVLSTIEDRRIRLALGMIDDRTHRRRGR
ncbi:MAG: hypothetical protein GY704_06810 [Phycisphaeraceae bacterium]|nr:hypothetical protein [Phycisphaeraceae bacterium]